MAVQTVQTVMGARNHIEEDIFMTAPDGSQWCRLCRNWADQGHLGGGKHTEGLVKWRRHVRAKTWLEKWYHEMPIKPQSDGLVGRDTFAATAKIMEDFGPVMQKNIESALDDAYDAGYDKGYMLGYSDGVRDEKERERTRCRSRSRSRTGRKSDVEGFG